MHTNSHPSSYSYPQPAQPATNHRYSGNSSAFSASANPNEDWTKISDLAERRRIQNRIAQRNYRKKLKKRLEDLERRAASNSASPEQRPAELVRPNSQQRNGYTRQDSSSDNDRHEYSRKPQDAFQNGYGYSTSEDRPMFAHQYTRQLSTSPPPFSYSTYPSTENVTCSPYPHSTAYHTVPATTGADMHSYASYRPSVAPAYPNTLPSLVHQRTEYYSEEEISPFSMSYASMAGIDISAPHRYAESSHSHTPPLSDSFEASVAGSPPDSAAYPTTPGSMPGTPPLHLVHC